MGGQTSQLQGSWFKSDCVHAGCRKLAMVGPSRLLWLSQQFSWNPLLPVSLHTRFHLHCIWADKLPSYFTVILPLGVGTFCSELGCFVFVYYLFLFGLVLSFPPKIFCPHSLQAGFPLHISCYQLLSTSFKAI